MSEGPLQSFFFPFYDSYFIAHYIFFAHAKMNTKRQAEEIFIKMDKIVDTSREREHLTTNLFSSQLIFHLPISAIIIQ